MRPIPAPRGRSPTAPRSRLCRGRARPPRSRRSSATCRRRARTSPSPAGRRVSCSLWTPRERLRSPLSWAGHRPSLRCRLTRSRVAVLASPPPDESADEEAECEDRKRHPAPVRPALLRLVVCSGGGAGSGCGSRTDPARRPGGRCRGDGRGRCRLGRRSRRDHGDGDGCRRRRLHRRPHRQGGRRRRRRWWRRRRRWWRWRRGLGHGDRARRWRRGNGRGVGGRVRDARCQGRLSPRGRLRRRCRKALGGRRGRVGRRRAGGHGRGRTGGERPDRLTGASAARGEGYDQSGEQQSGRCPSHLGYAAVAFSFPLATASLNAVAVSGPNRPSTVTPRSVWSFSTEAFVAGP